MSLNTKLMIEIGGDRFSGQSCRIQVLVCLLPKRHAELVRSAGVVSIV